VSGRVPHKNALNTEHLEYQVSLPEMSDRIFFKQSVLIKEISIMVDEKKRKAPSSGENDTNKKSKVFMRLHYSYLNILYTRKNRLILMLQL